MPYPRDVDAYPEMYLQISAVLRTQKEFKLGPMLEDAAVKIRHGWYAFVRAHRHTIDRVNDKITKARLAQKHALAKELIIPLQNELLLNRAREARLDVVKKFEVYLEPADIGTAYVCFAEKSLRFGVDVLAQVADAFNALPAAQRKTEEELQFELEAPAQPKAEVADVSLRNDATLGYLFTMPIEEKIRLGTATIEDLQSSNKNPKHLQELILSVSDNDARNTMLDYLNQAFPVVGPTIDIIGDLDSISPASPFEKN